MAHDPTHHALAREARRHVQAAGRALDRILSTRPDPWISEVAEAAELLDQAAALLATVGDPS